MPKSLIYCRVSSDRQVREGHGLDGQEQRCRSYAAERGYEVAEVFRDEGVSGGTVDREGIQKLLDYLDVHGRRESYVVLIDDIKRLARDVVGHFQLRKAILSRQANLESPSHKFGDSPEEVFGECILAATAELERNQNKRQVYNRMKARLEAGYWPFYQPPGYVYAKVAGHGKLLVRSEPEASIITEALEGFAAGRFPTQVEVQAFLQSKSFSLRGNGKMTYLEQVKRLLTRELYAGFISYPPWQVTSRKGHHEPLICGETFERIKERLADRKKAPQRRDIREDFPLRGFVQCNECHKSYTSCWSKGRNALFPYYLCKSPSCPMRNRGIRADKMHAEFDELLGKLKPRENIMAVAKAELLSQWQAKRIDVDAVRKERKQKLDAIENEISEYVEAVKRCHNAVVIQAIEEKIDELKAKGLRLGGRIKKPKDGDYDFQTAVNRVFDFLKNPLFMWKIGDLRQKRLVLRLVFAEPLTYERERGFQTAPLSLPLAISCVPELDEMEVVDMVRKSSNRLRAVIREGYEGLKDLREAT